MGAVFTLGIFFLGSILCAILGLALNFTVSHLSKKAKSQAKLQPNIKFREPKSFFVFRVIGTLFLVPFAFIVCSFIIPMLFTDPYFCTIPGITLIAIATRATSKKKNQTALRLIGALLLILVAVRVIAWHQQNRYTMYIVTAIGGIIPAIIGTLLLINARRTAREARKQAELQHTQYQEPTSVLVCGAIGAMLFSPLVHAVLTTIEVLSAESSNLPMVAAIACAVVGIILFVAAACMKGNAQKQMALRLVGSFFLILTVSGAVSIRFEIPLLFVVGAIVAAAFILIPDFLTNQKKYQRVFRLIGILLLLIAIGGAVIRYRENPDNKDFSAPTTATNSDPNYSEHTSMPSGHIVNHTYPDGWTDEPSSADSSEGKAKEPVSEEHSWSGSLSAEGLGGAAA